MIYLILIIAGIGAIILPASRLLIDRIQQRNPGKMTDKRKQTYRIIAIILSLSLFGIAIWMTNLLKVQ